MRKYVSVAAFVVLVSVSSGFSHPGRTDGSGGHYVRKSGYGYPVGSYHYHNGGPSIYSAPARSSAPVKAPSFSGFSKDDYKLVQQDLKNAGFYSGPIDGSFGEKSLQAMKDYQVAINKGHYSEQQMLEAILKSAKTSERMRAQSAVITPEVEAPVRVGSFVQSEKSDGAARVLDGKLLSGKTYVPIREISEAIGAKLEWNNDEKAAYLALGNGKSLKVANKAAEIGPNSLAGRLVAGKTYVPLREISEAISAKIEWNNTEKSAYMVISDSIRLKVRN